MQARGKTTRQRRNPRLAETGNSELVALKVLQRRSVHMDENRCSWERNASAVSSCDLAFQVSLIVISNLGECTPKKPFSGKLHR